MAKNSMRALALKALNEAEEGEEEPVKKSKKGIVFDVDEDEEDNFEAEEDEPPRKKIKAKRVELVDVKIGEKTYKVDKNAVTAIAALGDGNNKAVLQEIKRLSDEVKKVTPKAPAKKQAEAEDDGEEDPTIALFGDTKNYLKKLRAEIRQEVMAEVKAMSTANDTTKTFWTMFYDKHKDLRDDDDFVKLVLNRNQGDLGDLPVEEGMKKLADLTRKELLKVAKRYGGDRKPSKKHTEGEGESRTIKVALSRGDDDEDDDDSEEGKSEPKINSISGFLKQRRSNRLNARTSINDSVEEE